MTGIPLVKSVMTAFPHSIALDAPLKSAEELMARHAIRHLPVVEGGKLVGIISERDVNLGMSLSPSAYDSKQLMVSAAYIPQPYAVEMNARIDIVLREMVERHIGSAIVTKDGKVTGIFTATDACQHYRDLLLKVFGQPPPGTEAA